MDLKASDSQVGVGIVNRIRGNCVGCAANAVSQIVGDKFADYTIIIHSGCPVIRPAFAHSARLRSAQTARVRRPADQTIRNSMSKLVKDDITVECAVAVIIQISRSASEEEHLHARALSIGRRPKVGVVSPRSILRFCPDRIIADSATPEVVRLEVAGRFCEPEPVGEIMYDVVEIEEIGHRGRSLGPRINAQSEWEGEVLYGREGVSVLKTGGINRIRLVIRVGI